MKAYTDIPSYIEAAPKESEPLLKELYSLLTKAIPHATEAIKYGIPTLIYNKQNLIHFAGYRTHIGLYPGKEAIIHFSEELSQYKTSAGTIQFPLDQKLPLTLIRKILTYRIAATKSK